MANFIQMMQKAQVMKRKMEEMQDRVRDMEMDGAAGGGAVTCVVNGRFELRSLKISPSLVNPSEIDVLEDLIVAAVNDARAKAEKVMTDETRKIMAEAGLPADGSLPF
jgi:DNA-binding YbaB/EbfC family protein